jgi:hypothetical protein
MSKIKTYMDCCCFCRPYDDLSQHKVSFEREDEIVKSIQKRDEQL